MVRGIIRTTITACAGAVVLLACASNPEVIKKAPLWVTSPPADTPDMVYFVGVGSDSTGNVATAEEKAANSLVSEISKFIGVRVTAETTVEARDTMETYEAEIREKITESSFARISDFKVTDKWIDSKDDQVVVYLLGVYDRSALETEQARIRALFQEKEDAIAGPEREGDMLMSSGSPYKAALRYIEAAAAAAASDVDNASLRVERNINKAKEAVEKITLMVITGTLVAEARRPVDGAFSLRVVSGPGSDGPVLSGVNLLVSYRETQPGGRVRIRTEPVQTDAAGIAAFTPPPPNFVGTEEVTMILDLRSYMEALESVPREYREMVDGLENLVNGKRRDFQFISVSRAKDIPTAVITVDVDRAGNPRSFSDSSSGIMESLNSAGFAVIPVTVDIPVHQLNDAEVIRRVRADFGDKAERVVFGVFSITEFEESEGNFLVKVSGTVKAADLATGTILYTDSRTRRSRGSNMVSVITAAFRSLGKEFGEALASGLP